ncbi:MAG: ABC transporter substrate-binding protein [Chloroflexota bacterium]
MTAMRSSTRSLQRAGAGAFALLLAVSAVAVAQDPSPRPGPASDTLTFNSYFVDKAPLEIQAGTMDLYLYGLRTQAAQQLRDQKGVQLIEAPATSLSLVLNPAPAPEGKLNPFAIPEVRKAMQYLVDRNFIAQDIYQGLAEPMVTQVSPSDYDFLTVYDIDRGSGIRHDADYAKQQISDAMTKAGAELKDGVWTYNGEPVRVTFIARVEDERREIGDLVRSELEDAGFQVNMQYQQFAPAVLSVYSTDPQAFEWNIYTEGWSRGGAQRYDAGNVNSMIAPWLGNMPGWRESGFWQYTNDQADQIGQKLYKGQFQSQQERDDLYRQLTQIGLDESVRIWLATVDTAFPASDQVQDMTRDVASGPRTPWALRSAQIPGRSDIKVGDLWVWTERTTWNPIGGFGDAYSNDIWRNMVDPAVTTNPFTGDAEPFRAAYTVKTAGPGGTMDVPADAVTWDAATDQWVPVAAGTTAVSAVTYDYSKYLSSKWHDGQPITLADAFYGIAQSFDLAYDPDKAKVEVALAATSRPYLETIKGYQLNADDTITVYVDYWHFDENQIAAYASPTSFAMPWEMLAAMDDLVFNQRRAAYSDTAASRQNVPWLSLVLTKDARLVDRTLKQMGLKKEIPAGYFQVGDRNLVTEDEAAARYQAAQDWFDKTGNYVISSGPYMLSRYDQAAQFAQLDAFRDPSYPFTAKDFQLGPAPTIAVDVADAPEVVPGEDTTVDVSVQGPGMLALKWLLIDPSDGSVVTSGDGAAAGDGFSVTIPADVTDTLFPGLYQLDLAASSDQVALVAEREVDLEVTP